MKQHTVKLVPLILQSAPDRNVGLVSFNSRPIYLGKSVNRWHWQKVCWTPTVDLDLQQHRKKPVSARNRTRIGRYLSL